MGLSSGDDRPGWVRLDCGVGDLAAWARASWPGRLLWIISEAHWAISYHLIMEFVPRAVADRLDELSDVFRVVVLHGPRQAGKSTILAQFAASRSGAFANLDDPATLAAATIDPGRFVDLGARPRIIDEVQRGGDRLLTSITAAVDSHAGAGQFVVAGSTNFLSTRAISESLAGRAAYLTVWPFSMAERVGLDWEPDWLATLGQRATQLGLGWPRSAYLDLICTGGFPEPISLPARFRSTWFESYVDAVIMRDIREFHEVRNAAALQRILTLVATRAGSALVIGDVATTVEISATTVGNYLGYLEGVFLTLALPAWAPALPTQPARTSRSYIADVGLAAHLTGATPGGLDAPGSASLGLLVETFAVTELTRLLANDPAAPRLGHYRDRTGREIDVVAEYQDGSIIAIEVKATRSPSAADARHLTWLRDRMGERFRAGYILTMGDVALPFGDRITAIPLSALWNNQTVDH